MSSLGRGLESLIPPKDDGVSVSQDDNTAISNGGDFAVPEIQPAVSAAPLHVSAARRNPVPSSVPHPLPKKQNDVQAVFQIEVDKIVPNPEQPRRNFDEGALRELATSIREHGVLQPIVVSKIQKDTEEGSDVEYQLVAGERRLLASKLAGLERIPAIIRPMGAKREQLELAIIENLQREDLSPIERARAFARLQDEFGLTQREIAVRLGKSREVVANAIRLLNLPSNIQESLERGSINESQARLLLAVTDIASQQRLFNELLRNNLSVRELKSRIKRVNDSPKMSGESDKELEYNPEVDEVKEQLQQFFGAPVEVEHAGDKGKIVITFYSDEELRNIVSRLAASRDESDGFEVEDEFGV